MAIDSPYQQARTAAEYENYYENKYKAADLLEKKLLTKLIRQFKEANSLLEVGCGTGHFTRWLEQTFGLECEGLDFSKPMLNEAKKRWRQGAFLQCEGEQLSIRDKGVDLVVYITSFEYMPDPVKAIKEAARVARKGIVFGLMNKQAPETLRKRLQSKTQKDSFYSGAVFYSVTDIKEILQKAVHGKYEIAFWSTTVFPRVFDPGESMRFPFGAFLGIAVRLRDTIE